MARLVISPLADSDLNAILEFIARDKPEAAERWVQKIRDTCLLLAENPDIGERRPEFKTVEIRSSLVGRYVIFYRPIHGGIEIARVLSGEHDIRSLQ